MHQCYHRDIKSCPSGLEASGLYPSTRWTSEEMDNDMYMSVCHSLSRQLLCNMHRC